MTPIRFCLYDCFRKVQLPPGPQQIRGLIAAPGPGQCDAKGDRLPLAAVGIILGVDRILDMCRTCVNVWGDSVGAKIISA